MNSLTASFNIMLITGSYFIVCTAIQIDVTGNQSDTMGFSCGTRVTLVCRISGYSLYMSWNMNGVRIYECLITTCVQSPGLLPNITLSSNITAGVFTLIIDPVTANISDSVFECSDGSTSNTTRIKVADPVTRDKCSFENVRQDAEIKMTVTTTCVLQPQTVVILWQKEKVSGGTGPEDISGTEATISGSNNSSNCDATYCGGTSFSSTIKFTAQENGKKYKIKWTIKGTPISEYAPGEYSLKKCDSCWTYVIVVVVCLALAVVMCGIFAACVSCKENEVKPGNCLIVLVDLTVAYVVLVTALGFVLIPCATNVPDCLDEISSRLDCTGILWITFSVYIVLLLVILPIILCQEKGRIALCKILKHPNNSVASLLKCGDKDSPESRKPGRHQIQLERHESGNVKDPDDVPTRLIPKHWIVEHNKAHFYFNIDIVDNEKCLLCAKVKQRGVVEWTLLFIPPHSGTRERNLEIPNLRENCVYELQISKQQGRILYMTDFETQDHPTTITGNDCIVENTRVTVYCDSIAPSGVTVAYRQRPKKDWIEETSPPVVFGKTIKCVINNLMEKTEYCVRIGSDADGVLYKFHILTRDGPIITDDDDDVRSEGRVRIPDCFDLTEAEKSSLQAEIREQTESQWRKVPLPKTVMLSQCRDQKKGTRFQFRIRTKLETIFREEYGEDDLSTFIYLKHVHSQ